MLKKSVFKSKTFWFGVNAIALGIVSVINKDYAIGVGGIITGLGTIACRFTTNTKVYIKK
ncbi:MAG TPA: hypothetical protein PLN38_04855 [Chitinophagales bacterium]|nr:hypothetical protein [Chitinophagales bacterium]